MYEITNVPDIADVGIMADLLRAIGLEVGVHDGYVSIVNRGDLTPVAPYELVAQMPKNAQGGVDRDVAIEWVRTNVNRLIKWTAGSSANASASYGYKYKYNYYAKYGYHAYYRDDVPPASPRRKPSSGP